MTKFEMQSEIDNITLELRSLIDEAKKEGSNVEEIRGKKKDLEEKRNALVKELAEFDRPVEKNEARSLAFDKDEWIKAAQEKRSLTIGSTGSINQVKQLFKEVADNDDLLSKATFYLGRDAATNIPVLAPIDDPSSFAEGATDVSVDTSANVAVTEIAPLGYARVLSVTAEALTMNTLNLEGELPAIFGKAFKKVMHQGMLTGAGTNKQMKGIFTSAASNASGKIAGSPGSKKLISELAELALKVSSKDEKYSIVMNPAEYQAFLSDSTAGEDIKLYKEQLIRDKSIEGVEIILDGKAPVATVDGAAICVAAPLGRYCIGQASQVNIDAIKVKGDTNTYYQATMFFSGKQLSDKDVYWLEFNT